MRLLVVSQYYWPEPFRITDICESLVKRGHIVDVLTSVPNVPQGRFYEGYGWFARGEKEHNGVNITRVGVFRRGGGSGLRLVLNCASFAVNSLFHIGKLKKNDYDAVFVFNNSPVTKIFPAKVMAKKKRIPNIVFLLDIWPQSFFFLIGMTEGEKRTLFQRLSYKFSVWLYKSVDLMLISSRGFEAKLRDMGVGCALEYFPNYAEVFEATDFLMTRADLGLSDGDFILAFAGNIGKAQGLELTVEALSAADARGVKWLIIGDGPELETLKARVKAAGLADYYVFTGWVEGTRLPAYLELADVLFLPLKSQEVLNLTVPAKLQTYMYAKKAVLAFMDGAGAGLVSEAKCGVVAKAEDPAELAKAVSALLSMSAEELRAMGENGRRYCENNFDKEAQIDRLIEYICSAVRGFGIKGKDESIGNHSGI